MIAPLNTPSYRERDFVCSHIPDNYVTLLSIYSCLILIVLLISVFMIANEFGHFIVCLLDFD